jgi:hypothetical protein
MPWPLAKTWTLPGFGASIVAACGDDASAISFAAASAPGRQFASKVGGQPAAWKMVRPSAERQPGMLLTSRT